MAYWITWLSAGVFFVMLFTVIIIPKVMLKSYSATLPVRVKAVERFSDAYGEVVVYSAPVSARGYIKSYRIGRDAGGVYFRGEWAKNVACAEYELTVYGVRDNVIDVLRVKEKFNGGKTTHDTRLRKGADYVTLRVLCVDDEPLPADRRKFNFAYAFWLAVLCISLVFAVDAILWLVATFVLRCIDGFTMTLGLTVSEWAAILGYPAIAIVVITLTASLGCLYLRKRRETEYE